MKAVLIKNYGQADQLYIGDYEQPQPQSHELLIKVQATAVNRADIAQREGHYPSPADASPLMGLELAGIVEKVGDRVTKWKEGDRVFGLLGGGGYAEYAVIPESMAMELPDNMAFTTAAAIPEVFLTAYQTLFWVGRLQKGERVLIHAGASGVGTAAIQLAKQAGAEVVATAGSEGKLEACRHFGADLAINYKTDAFDKVIEANYGANSIDVILDFIGASYWEKNEKVIAMDGRHVLISTLGGAKINTFHLGRLMAKRATVTGTTLRSRSLEYKERLTDEFAIWALPLFKAGKITPVVDRVFPIEKVKEAHEYMEANKNIGKIVLSMTTH
ncbi:putative PIG3 family NAD(P)H quinone oxidoreductase [Pullulanibacillus pueri]|uniref:Alcohol dehydrogenase n=1 Tax=Pullulanibacillus pueri TaxID=1437324 RepID=A0A8J2ZUH1_9BACL|nr:NAD(P)H-quinone oxidoreductase [Pullulanibacillus pueri]MBM7681106.1 putative PIG3 family NAD(P)H quinone oxidoreductase [Pullulanibacillus pueri]GGH77069.1 alcohol dehydrogenase [Pullulanibacillus pueri]